MELWTIILAVAGPVGIVIVFAIKILQIRDLERRNRKSNLEIEKLESERKESGSPIYRPNRDEIGRYGHPLRFQVLGFPVYLWLVLGVTSLSTVLLGLNSSELAKTAELKQVQSATVAQGIAEVRSKVARDRFALIESMRAAEEASSQSQSEYVRRNLNAMAVKLDEMQAELRRLDALGEELAKISGIKPYSEKMKERDKVDKTANPAPHSNARQEPPRQ